MRSLSEKPEVLVEEAFALQVKADVLGAHLEAYINMRPTLKTLRLCNRFGPEDLGISKLPIELLDQVAEYLLEDERKKLRLKWAYTRKCFADASTRPIISATMSCMRLSKGGRYANHGANLIQAASRSVLIKGAGTQTSSYRRQGYDQQQILQHILR